MKFKKLLSVVTMIGVMIMSVISANAANAADVTAPNLTIDINCAAVTVQKASDEQISIGDYDSSVFSVTINNDDDNNWSVDIHSLINPNEGNPPLTLYLPERSYGDITTNVKYGHFDNKAGVFKSGNISGTYYMGSVYHVLPKGFSGNVKLTAEGGMTQVTSKDSYANSNVTLKNNGKKWTAFVYAPNSFIRSSDGNTYTYANGTEVNLFDLTLTGQGVIRMD